MPSAFYETISFHAIGLGVAKSGTTWLAAQLRTHPALACTPAYPLLNAGYLAAPTEFMQLYLSGLEPQQKYFTYENNYLFSPTILEIIRKTQSSAKLFCIVRSPEMRAISNFLHRKRVGLINRNATLNKCLEDTELQRVILDRGRYEFYIPQWLDSFGPERFKILIYEDIHTCPERLLAELASFLGIENRFTLNEARKKINEARESRFPGISRLIRKQQQNKRLYSPLQRVGLNPKQLFGLFRRLIEKPMTEGNGLEQLDDFLIQSYEPTRDYIETVTGRDLSGIWPLKRTHDQ